jgi:ABC-type lipoprotein export system ATPase subunit
VIVLLPQKSFKRISEMMIKNNFFLFFIVGSLFAEKNNCSVSRRGHSKKVLILTSKGGGGNMTLASVVKDALDNKKYNMPGELSGGEQQRVSIARSLANDPKILLADEPTGNLDPNTSEAVFNMFMKAVKSRNLTVLMVTHNLDMAKLAHRSYTLSNGKLLTSSS